MGLLGSLSTIVSRHVTIFSNLGLHASIPVYALLVFRLRLTVGERCIPCYRNRIITVDCAPTSIVPLLFTHRLHATPTCSRVAVGNWDIVTETRPWLLLRFKGLRP